MVGYLAVITLACLSQHFPTIAKKNRVESTFEPRDSEEQRRERKLEEIRNDLDVEAEGTAQIISDLVKTLIEAKAMLPKMQLHMDFMSLIIGSHNLTAVLRDVEDE